MNGKLNVFLDDERQMPTGYDVHVYTAEEAINLINNGRVSYISLDNDLGESKSEGKKVAQFIEHAYALAEIHFVAFGPHTANPVARQEILTCKTNVLKLFSERRKVVDNSTSTG